MESVKRYGVVPGLLVFEMEEQKDASFPESAWVIQNEDGSTTVFDHEKMQIWRLSPGVSEPREVVTST